MKRVLVLMVLLVASFAALADAPAGIGSLKLGMSKTAVEALPSNGMVYLDGGMAPFSYKYSKPVPGQQRFKVKLVTPWSTEPVESTLTFSNGSLTEIYVTLDELMVREVRKQIASKYGEPKIKDTMQDKRCDYPDGVSFSMPDGMKNAVWSGLSDEGKDVLVEAGVAVISVCPFDSSAPHPTPQKMYSLEIRYGRDAAPANPF